MLTINVKSFKVKRGIVFRTLRLQGSDCNHSLLQIFITRDEFRINVDYCHNLPYAKFSTDQNRLLQFLNESIQISVFVGPIIRIMVGNFENNRVECKVAPIL